MLVLNGSVPYLKALLLKLLCFIKALIALCNFAHSLFDIPIIKQKEIIIKVDIQSKVINPMKV